MPIKEGKKKEVKNNLEFVYNLCCNLQLPQVGLLLQVYCCEFINSLNNTLDSTELKRRRRRNRVLMNVRQYFAQLIRKKQKTKGVVKFLSLAFNIYYSNSSHCVIGLCSIWKLNVDLSEKIGFIYVLFIRSLFFELQDQIPYLPPLLLIITVAVLVLFCGG